MKQLLQIINIKKKYDFKDNIQAKIANWEKVQQFSNIYGFRYEPEEVKINSHK